MHRNFYLQKRNLKACPRTSVCLHMLLLDFWCSVNSLIWMIEVRISDSLLYFICKTILLSGAKRTPSEDRLTKNEKMTSALAEVMARSTTDLSDELLERWLELRHCFSA